MQEREVIALYKKVMGLANVGMSFDPDRLSFGDMAKLTRSVLEQSYTPCWYKLKAIGEVAKMHDRFTGASLSDSVHSVSGVFPAEVVVAIRDATPGRRGSGNEQSWLCPGSEGNKCPKRDACWELERRLGVHIWRT